MTVSTTAAGATSRMDVTVPMSPVARVRDAHCHPRPLGRPGGRRRSLMGLAFTWVALGLLLGVYLLTAPGTIVGDRQAKRDERCVNAQTDY